MVGQDYSDVRQNIEYLRKEKKYVREIEMDMLIESVVAEFNLPLLKKTE